MTKSGDRPSDVNLNKRVRARDEGNHAPIQSRTQKDYGYMSQIEKLKAEAEELESRQRTQGNPIKHCEALEQVAKKHGYSGWRACRARLGDGPAASPPMKRYRSAEWNFAIDERNRSLFRIRSARRHDD